ncbi:MAG: UDP-N-acetylmuramoyl-L-alanine--D-glutamate ligase [Erysipelotrichales bacterium]|nr:UDP-N-acetylmuramoyl-L-alanine--D-glutamate ligase [Erysipelotrichales bacterium]
MKYLILGKGKNGEGIKLVLEHLKIDYDFLDTAEVKKLNYNLVIKSPGIPIDLPIFTEFKKKGIEVITDIELCYRYFPRRYIAITGTNGKTSTTKMLAEILAKEVKAVACGNIGYTICQAILEHPKDTIFVVELSSFQLNNCRLFKPEISMLLNLGTAHQDFHGNIPNYHQAKVKIAINQTEKNLLIYNSEDKNILKMISDLKVSKLSFSSKISNNDCYLKGDYLYFKGQKIIKKKLFEQSLSVVADNVLAALSTALYLGISKQTIKKYFKEPKIDLHRLEPVGKYNFNDAKSTNPASAVMALNKMTEPVLLLCGGKKRNENLLELEPVLMKIKRAYAYGETSLLLKEYFNKNNIECEVFVTLEEALISIKANRKKKEVLLFSPMMASWDQFKSYEERGEIFKNFWA